jgi:UDP-N-acetyl-D-glucosamine dehydrogenase
MVVVVQGLGFVGAVMSLVVASSSKKYQVIGVDLPSNQVVIEKLNSGVFPIESSDPKVQEYFNQAIKRGNFRATSDISAYSEADVVIVDINLDVQKGTSDEKFGNDYSVNLSGFKKAMRTIAENCKDDVLVLVETTVPPGTCEKIVKPIFEEVFEDKGKAINYKIGHSYERVMPGPGYVDSIQNFYRVYSGIDEQSADAVEAFLKTIISTDQYPLTRLGNTTATEMAKVLENSFRAMNIAFIQEWTEFAENAGVNLFEVIDAIRMRPTHKNIMRPGLGVGGYCLTKDPLLASWASQALFGGNKLPQSEKAVKINDAMPLHSYRMIEKHFNGELQKKRFLILGVSYLQDVGDTRFTPVESVYKKLLANKVNISLHDPYVSEWEEIAVVTESEKEILNKEYDAVIIGTPHSIYLNNGLLDKILSNHKSVVVFDPYGCISVDTRKKFLNHSFKITGRGDV